jgi:hypothetical protein
MPKLPEAFKKKGFIKIFKDCLLLPFVQNILTLFPGAANIQSLLL